MQLTQDVIYNYTRRSVDRIKSLKIVGFGLTDVSILRGAVSVEILNLTSNQIGTLSHFEPCSELQQLLLRDNNIRELREIEYLKDLKNLHTLVLSQNPFCGTLGSEYRAMVLRVLPNLTFLDMIEVTREELAAALRRAPSIMARQPQRAREESVDPAPSFNQNMRALVYSPGNVQWTSGGQTEHQYNHLPELPVVPHVSQNQMRHGFGSRQLRQGRSGCSLGYPGYPGQPRMRSNVLKASLNLVMDLNLNELVELEAAVRNRIQAVTQD